jgi:flavin reductase (DIM6/NTAB) family NADH-FMN oxidoreductase RutF
MSVNSMPSLETADRDKLRRTMGTFATGVTVVTTGGDSPHGMTANSFTSVSMDPPLVLVCVGRTAIMHRKLATGFFGVSVLSAGQQAVGRHFADLSRPVGREQFDGIDWTPGRVTGSPLIGGALARLECELWASYDGGDHTIFTGRLLSMDRTDTGEGALLFYRGRFGRLEPERSEVAR